MERGQKRKEGSEKRDFKKIRKNECYEQKLNKDLGIMKNKKRELVTEKCSKRVRDYGREIERYKVNQKIQQNRKIENKIIVISTVKGNIYLPLKI